MPISENYRKSLSLNTFYFMSLATLVLSDRTIEIGEKLQLLVPLYYYLKHLNVT
jgi:hypothetical protein